MAELLARLQVLQRRDSNISTVLQVGDLSFDTKNLQIKREQELIALNSPVKMRLRIDSLAGITGLLADSLRRVWFLYRPAEKVYLLFGAGCEYVFLIHYHRVVHHPTGCTPGFCVRRLVASAASVPVIVCGRTS